MSEALVQVKVKPNARTDGVTGFADGVLHVSVRAVAEKGRANEAVCKVIARWIGCAPSNVSVVSGGGARTKRVRIEGLSDVELRARLATL